MPKKYTGRCACNAVQFEFDAQPAYVAVCHCLDCKKASGAEAETYFPVPTSDFTLITGNPIGFPYTANSGKHLERAFCPKCGARLYARTLESFPGTVFVQIGSLDSPGDFPATLEMFTKRRLGWERQLDLPQFTDMPS